MAWFLEAFDTADLNRGKGAARRAAANWWKSRMNSRFPPPRASAGEVLNDPLGSIVLKNLVAGA